MQSFYELGLRVPPLFPLNLTAEEPKMHYFIALVVDPNTVGNEDGAGKYAATENLWASQGPSRVSSGWQV